MASPFGISFVPGAQPDNQNGMSGGRGGASRNPIQEAVKILSLRLPKFYGSGSIAPAPLLQAPGGEGATGCAGECDRAGLGADGWFTAEYGDAATSGAADSRGRRERRDRHLQGMAGSRKRAGAAIRRA